MSFNEQLNGTPINLKLRNPQQTINQQNIQTIAKILNIDTRFRENYYATDVEDIIIDLPEPIEKVTSMTIQSIQIPSTIYNIDSMVGNNYFHVYDPSGLIYGGLPAQGAGLRKFVVENGNYFYPPPNSTGQEIELAINKSVEYDIATNTPRKRPGTDTQIRFDLLFTNNNLLTPYTVDQFSYRSLFRWKQDTAATPEYSSLTDEFRVYFNLKPNATTTPDIDPTVVDQTPLQLKLGWLLGYRFGQYVNPDFADASNNVSYVSEGVYDPQSPRYFFIIIDDFNNNYNQTYIGSFNKSSLQGNVLARVPIDISQKTSNGPLMLTTAQSTTRMYHGPVKISKLRIKLIDPYGRKMNLHNMDYTISLQLNCMYN